MSDGDQPYLVGAAGKRITAVLGPYDGVSVKAAVAGERTLREEHGATEVYAVRAKSADAARRKVQREIA